MTFPAYDTTEVKMRSKDQVQAAFQAWQATNPGETTTPIGVARRRVELLASR